MVQLVANAANVPTAANTGAKTAYMCIQEPVSSFTFHFILKD
jgi:hypothetical protein